MSARWPIVLFALWVQLLSAGSAGAQGASLAEAGAETVDAKNAFREGVEQRKMQKWSQALAQFKAALSGAGSARNAAVIQFNMSICERALGRYVSARQRWLALVQQPDLLDEDAREKVEHYLKESEQLIAWVTVTLEPESATLLIDDWPLQPHAEGADHFQADFEGKAESAHSLERQTFTLLIEAGSHIIRAKRDGHADAVVNRSFKGGETNRLTLKLAVLPATVNVESEPHGAFVKVDGQSFGVTPSVFEQPAGKHRLTVERSDYDLYQQELSLQPGQRLDLVVPLNFYDPPFYTKWWFWTGTGAALAAATLATYFAVRADPRVPAYEGGSTGVVFRAP
jgi:hypothetical protein